MKNANLPTNAKLKALVSIQFAAMIERFGLELSCEGEPFEGMAAARYTNRDASVALYITEDSQPWAVASTAEDVFYQYTEGIWSGEIRKLEKFLQAHIS